MTALLLATALLGACATEPAGQLASLEAGASDAGASEAGAFDASTFDAGGLEAGALESAAFDAGASSGGGHPADPYESTNRELLESNLWTYDEFIAPGVETYRRTVPEPLRAGVSNVIDNLGEPRVFINDLLQGEFERAATSLARFAFNTTIGFGGLFDRASQMGLAAHDEDFGQTLAVHGVAPGPYLVLPLLGPSNPRDALAWVVDLALDPANYLLFPVSFGANLVGTTVDRFARDPDRLAAFRETSMDFYTTARDAYLQNRAYEIANGAAGAGLAGLAGAVEEADNLGGGLAGLDPDDDELDALFREDAGGDLDEARLEPSLGAPPSDPAHPSRGRSGFSVTGF